MPAVALVTHGFGFSLGTRFIPTLGLGAGPAPRPPVPGTQRLSLRSSTVSLFSTPPGVRLDWAPLISGSAPYTGAKMLLYTNDMTPTEGSVVGDFTEADFGGYTAGGVAVTWDTPYIDGQGNVHLPADNVIFLCTGTPGNSVFGYYLLTSTGDYLGGARFDDAPRNVPGAGYGIDASVEVII